MNKIRKYIGILSSINWWQTWILYRLVKKPRSSSIRVLNSSNIKIAPSATIEMSEYASLEINRQDYIKTHERSTLYLGENAHFKLNGRFTIHGHSSIMIHDGAHLEIGNNTYLNGGSIDCFRHICIGNDCAIADGVRIMDNSWHAVASQVGGGQNQDWEQCLDSYRCNDSAWCENRRWYYCGSWSCGYKRCAAKMHGSRSAGKGSKRRCRMEALI